MATSGRPRVFLDANVIYSGIHSSGSPPSRILALHAIGAIQAVVSQLVIDETLRNVRAKAPTALPDLFEWLVNVPPDIVPDPSDEGVSAGLVDINFEDAPVWAAALASDVDYFVTGDRRFLREARAAQTSLTALTPRELIDRLERSP